MAGQRISVLQRARMQREMRKESRTGKMRNSMEQTEQRMKTRWILVFLAMLVCFCGWWAVRKEGFFADELYSYGLSNSDYAPFLSWYYNGERAYSGTSAEHIYSREDFMSYSAAALAGVGGMMLTFPCWLAQLHSQSTVSLDTTTDNILNLSQYPKGPLELTGWSIVEFGVGAGIMALLLLVALTKRFLPGKLRQTVLIAPRAKLITIPALAAFIVIAVISPYKSLRYVYHLQPLEALFCGCGFFAVLDTLGQNARKKITQAVCALMLVLAFVLTPERMYIGNRKVNEELEQYSDAQCVSLIGDMTAFTSELPEYLHFKEICAVQDTSSTLLREYCTGESDSMVVFICGRGLWQFVTPGEVEQITQENQASAEEIARLGGYTSVEMLDTQEFSQIWVLKK